VPDAAAVVAAAADSGYLLRLVDEGHVAVALDETTTAHDVEIVLRAFGVETALGFKPAGLGVSPELVRTSRYLEHPVFSAHRSETTMMRYLKHLADKDYALARGMIPLGSCTMKLNAATEMAAITWPEFADIHPFAPESETEGYRDLIAQLEGWLAELTGYDA